LNDIVRGTKEEKSSILQTIVASAAVRERALEFNYASEALNNSFFLDALKPPPGDKGYLGHEQSLLEYTDFSNQIQSSFGGLPQLKSLFSSAAMGMSGSGWVWLVAGANKELAVVATYGAGTVLVRSREEKVTLNDLIGNDFSSNPRRATAPELSRYAIPPHIRQMQSPTSSPSSGTSLPDNSSSNSPKLTRSMYRSRESSPLNSFGSHARNPKTEGTREKAGPGADLTPLLTCSVHERSWLYDHGIWGKEKYLTSFWEVVDWRKVAASFEVIGKSSKFA